MKTDVKKSTELVLLRIMKNSLFSKPKAWKVDMKSTRLTWKRPSFWSMAFTLMSSRTQASSQLCAVCCSGVSNDSTKFSPFKLWVHKKCSITGWLVGDYVFSKCRSKTQPIDGRPVTQLGVDWTMLDMEAIFFYLHYTCWAPMEAVIVPLPPDIAWLGENSGKSCPSSPPGTSPLRYTTRCTGSVSTQLCSAVVKHGGPSLLTCQGSAAMTAAWSAESVVPKTKTKRHLLHSRNWLGIKDITTVLHSRRLTWSGHVVCYVL